MTRVRQRLLVRGVVQGVGFRPYVYRVATELHLGGSVCNRGDAGVEVVVEGPPEAVATFVERVRRRPPQLARIEQIEIESLDPLGQSEFSIAPSRDAAGAGGAIPPDTTICAECVRELREAGRYHGYWATSCTDCGPRFTVIEGLPYDRPQTSMRDFPLCSACAAEYGNPLDRRYHAQTTACPACGPRLAFDGAPADAFERAVGALRAGEIVAVKGLGGTHLACRADDDGPVGRLRARLGRSGQPFAVMTREEDVEAIAIPSAEMWGLLRRPERPIVVLGQRPGALPESVAPGLDSVGVMLPYSGLQVLLLDQLREPLVMTSGNLPGLPMWIANDEIVACSRGIADHTLTHDRRIVARCDDSVVRRAGGRTVFLRRSRGYTPERFPIDLGVASLLALGPETGVTFALYADRAITLSQHIGSVDSLDTLGFLREAVEHLQRLTAAPPPRIVACDLHPQFMTTRLAREVADTAGAQVIAVQHHAAHAAATLAEHGLEDGVVVVLDGYGYGDDGAAWGGETFAVRDGVIERAASLRPVPLPGGDLATRFPLRAAAGYLWAAGFRGDALRERLAARGLADAAADVVTQQLARAVNAPATTSAGRFLDAVAAWLGVCRERTYEGEPAMRLEAAARTGCPLALPVTVGEAGGRLEVDLVSVFASLVEMEEEGVPLADLAATAQAALARGAAAAAIRVAKACGATTVGLSGGVAVNDAIASEYWRSVEANGLRAVTNLFVPCGDGGVSFGQAVFAGRGMRLVP